MSYGGSDVCWFRFAYSLTCPSDFLSFLPWSWTSSLKMSGERTFGKCYGNRSAVVLQSLKCVYLVKICNVDFWSCVDCHSLLMYIFPLFDVNIICEMLSLVYMKSP